MNYSIIIYALCATIFTYSFTLVGSSFVLFAKKINNSILNMIISLSTGVMLSSIFFSLLNPALTLSKSTPFISTIFLFAGVLLIYLIDKISCKAFNMNKNFNIILSVILHNIPEGLVVGLAFSSVQYYDLTITSAISLILGIGMQNLPEGIAVAFPLLKNGYTRKKAFFYAQLCGISEILSGVIGVIFIDKLINILPVFMFISAGVMLYVVLCELIPNFVNENKKEELVLLALLGFASMMFLEIFFN